MDASKRMPQCLESYSCSQTAESPGKLPRLLMDCTLNNSTTRRLVIEFPTDFATDTVASRTNGEMPDHHNQRKAGSREVVLLKRNDSFLIQPQPLELDAELSTYANSELEVERLPNVDTLAAPKLCSVRLRHLVDMLEEGAVVRKEDLVSNLKYSMSVLDTLYIEETNNLPPAENSNVAERRLLEEDDALNEVEPDAVPTEVREWLAQTFTRSQSSHRTKGERPKFKSVAQAVRAGIMVDRLYRRWSSTIYEKHVQPPPHVADILKDIHVWSFNIFDLNQKSEGQALRYVGHELLYRQGLVGKLKVNPTSLENFLVALQRGYSPNNNPYHNQLHGADVAQTTYNLLQESGLMNWLSDIEIFATLIAALIHDYDHTGTTNNFHIMTSSPLALLYNDKSVLENHHIQASFALMRKDDMNILSGLKQDEYKEFRSLVIDVVLATDMSCHFQQLKTIKSLLNSPENIEKSKALCLIIHASDISHPAKPWQIHKPWTDLLLEEFFKQGDREKELGLPCSPLCDRQSTLVEKSQIGFITFIVEPTFNVMGDMMDQILLALQGTSHQTSTKTTDKLTVNDLKSPGKRKKMDRPWEQYLAANRLQWMKLAGGTDFDTAAISNSADDERTNREKNNNMEKPNRGISRSTSTTGLISENMMELLNSIRASKASIFESEQSQISYITSRLEKM